MLGLLGAKDSLEEGIISPPEQTNAAATPGDANNLVELLDALGQSGDAACDPDCLARAGASAALIDALAPENGPAGGTEAAGRGNREAPPKAATATLIRAGRPGTMLQAAPAPPQRLAEGKRAIKGLRGRYGK